MVKRFCLHCEEFVETVVQVVYRDKEEVCPICGAFGDGDIWPEDVGREYLEQSGTKDGA